MKKIALLLSLVLALSLILCACSTKKEEAEVEITPEALSGALADNDTSYKNDFLGLGFTLPDDNWTIVADPADMLDQVNGMLNDEYESALNSAQLITAFVGQCLSGDNAGSSVSIGLEKMSIAVKNMSFENYAALSKIALENAFSDISTSLEGFEATTLDLAGEECNAFVYTYTVSGIDLYINQFTVDKGDYRATITASATSPEYLQTIVDSFFRF